jgi:glycosyltransferase involved in cell wall biosynthesis
VKASPPLTVILPAHNAEATIAPAIVSTLNQTFTDFELWVLENGSNDRTAEIARSFTDPRVTVFELGPVGVGGAMQYAIENASSEWLGRMDADDLMFPNRLEVEMDFIRRNPEVAFVGTACAYLTPYNHIIEAVLPSGTRKVTKDDLALNKRFFGDPSIVFNRHVAMAAGGADLEFSKVDGVPLLFRLLAKGPCWELAEYCHLYRVRPHSLSREGREHAEQARRVRLKYAPECASHYEEPREMIAGGWYTVAVMELLAGDGKATREAVNFLRSEIPRTADRIRWLSYLGKIGRLFYKWRNPQKRSFRRRTDWEQLFELLLKSRPSESSKDTPAILKVW